MRVNDYVQNQIPKKKKQICEKNCMANHFAIKNYIKFAHILCVDGGKDSNGITKVMQ